jgi:ribosome modulation factor
VANDLNKALDGAKFKGFVAGLQGVGPEKCPYSDWRTNYRNSVTFSTAFRKQWFKGREEGDQLRRKITGHPRWSDAVLHVCPLCGYRTDATNVHRKCPKAPLEEVTQPIYCEVHGKVHAVTVEMPFGLAKRKVYLSHSTVPMAVVEEPET